MPNPILILNQPYVNVGLGTVTNTIATTGLYSVKFGTTVPVALATGDGAGSGQGLGSGRGGGAEGFVGGDLGLGHGGVGQGFGPSNGYQQPPAAGSNAVLGAPVNSALVVIIQQNGSTIFTAPALAAGQSEMQFKFGFQATAADVINVVLSSANGSDAVLNGIKSTIAINQGL